MKARETFEIRGAFDGIAAMNPAATVVRSRLTAILLMMLIVVLGLVVFGNAPAAASGGAGGEGSVAVSDAQSNTVVISNFAFGPASLTVAPGTKITVVNRDRAPHTVTARNRSFDTGTIAGGQRGEITAPSSPGTYPYICALHPSMTGILIVK